MSGLLPNGQQQFIDGDGNPYALGYVYMYVPGTTVPKDTWQDIDLTILNTNPIRLDAAGRATIWGAGTYRQLLKDVNGNVVWDKITVAGSSGGPPPVTVVTVADSPYTVTSTDQFLAVNCDTGNIIINLMNATQFSVNELTIKNIGSNAYFPVVTPTGGQTVDGISAYGVAGLWESISIVPNEPKNGYYIK